jgi:hypothetical protein
MLNPITSRLKAFFQDDDGNMSIEALIFIPFVLTLLASTFSFYDAFRFKALNTKAAFTISDALSRQTEAITPAYIDGMVSTLKFLTRSESHYSLRITMVRYDANDELYKVNWSQARGIFAPLSAAGIQEIRGDLPNLLHNEVVIVVETQTDYDTPFPISEFVTDDLFYNFAFTRPRFAPQLIWEDDTNA